LTNIKESKLCFARKTEKVTGGWGKNTNYEN